MKEILLAGSYASHKGSVASRLRSGEPSFRDPELSEQQAGRTSTDLMNNSFSLSDWQHPAGQLLFTGPAAPFVSIQSDNLLVFGLNSSFPGELTLFTRPGDAGRVDRASQ